MYQIQYGTYELPEEFVVDTLDLTGLPIRTSSQELTGQDGGVIWDQKYGMRTIIIGGTMYANTATNYYNQWREVISEFSIQRDSLGVATTKQLKVTLPTGEVVYANCKTLELPDIVETAGQVNMGRFYIVLQSESPYFKGADVDITLYAADKTGFPVATVVPTPLGGMPTNAVSINITGDLGGYPSYMIYKYVTNPRITNQTTGKSWGLDMDVDATTGSIPVYYDKSGVRVGVNNEYIQYFVGDFFNLQKGVNNIIFTGSNVSSSKVELTWWNEYLSV